MFTFAPASISVETVLNAPANVAPNKGVPRNDERVSLIISPIQYLKGFDSQSFLLTLYYGVKIDQNCCGELALLYEATKKNSRVTVKVFGDARGVISSMSDKGAGRHLQYDFFQMKQKMTT